MYWAQEMGYMTLLVNEAMYDLWKFLANVGLMGERDGCLDL